MAVVTLSGKNKIVVPKGAREALGLKAGDRLLLTVQANTIIMIREPESHLDALRGLTKGLYSDGYLEEERKSWER